MNIPAKLSFIAALFLLGSSSVDAQFLKSGDIRVYANAIVSSQLDTGMAQKYGISRSASNVLLHVVVRRGEPGADKTLPAEISAVAIRKNGERRSINMQVTRDGEEIYYLGELNITVNEAVQFEIVARTESQPPMSMTFFQEFFSQ